jgi:hypothetical protein
LQCRLWGPTNAKNFFLMSMQKNPRNAIRFSRTYIAHPFNNAHFFLISNAMHPTVCNPKQELDYA